MSDPISKRNRILVGVLLALFTTHFAIVYLNPRYLGLEKIRRGGGGRGVQTMPEGRVLRFDDKRLLMTSASMDDAFDIGNAIFEPVQLNYGIGRESFPALFDPTFVDHAKAKWMEADHRVLLVHVNGDARVYPIDQLIRHEVVNDTVGDMPIFAAYCILADLGAVYDRRLDDDRALTFALTGYTYHDPKVWDGMDAFMLWDRDTESLWWPPIGKAVSGPLLNTPLKLLDESNWSQTTFASAVKQFPTARVLDVEQNYAPPSDWPRMEIAALNMEVDPTTQPAASSSETSEVAATQPASPITPPPGVRIAPRWGENADL